MLQFLLFMLGMVAYSSANDAILTPETAGSPVVEAATNLITASCVFDDDKMFLRRLAYVETRDGITSHTYRAGYNGGIWQVDEKNFKLTKHSSLSKYQTSIKASFLKYNIDWGRVVWSDLRKPLYSALAARLFLQYRKVNIPRSVVDQANLWKNIYRNTGQTSTFIQLSKHLEKHCSTARADIMFVLDGSGSIGAANFRKTKNFVKNFIQGFDIGPNKNRVGVIQYGSKVKIEFNMARYSNSASLLSRVHSIKYGGGGTPTDAALDLLVNSAFTRQNGARLEANVAKVAIVLTDGRSNKKPKTLAAAARVHKADITVFSVGVGSNIDKAELNSIASDPVCLHRFEVTGFNEIDSLRSTIEKRTCEAPITIAPEGGGEIEVPLPPGGNQNCKIKLDKQGTTVKVESNEGTVYFYIAKGSYPSEAYYDHKIVSVPGIRGVVFVSHQKEDFVFCNIKSNSSTGSNVTIDVDEGDTDNCKNVVCQNGGTCSDTGSGWSCVCAPGWTGKNCETHIDYCKNVVCQHGGTCSDTASGGTCACLPGWKGANCETPPPGCPRGYSCKDGCYSPCTRDNIKKAGYFWAMDSDKTKYIECAGRKLCEEKSCATGLIWNSKNNACSSP